MKAIGIVILIIGIALTIITSTKIFTKEKVIDMGAVEITRDKPHSFSWSPILGLVVIAVGSVVIWKGNKK